MVRTIFGSLLLMLMVLVADAAAQAKGTNDIDRADSTLDTQKPIVPVGIFLGKIEEGARIFTPARLLPFDHPEALGHEFPTVLQLHQTEYEVLVWLGEQAGMKLATTLQRYPEPPTDEWWYQDFAELPVSEIKPADLYHFKKSDRPIPGLSAAANIDGEPVAFIVDTRDVTLEERNMQRATAMGLDLSRAEFLSGLHKAARMAGANGTMVVVFDK